MRLIICSIIAFIIVGVSGHVYADKSYMLYAAPNAWGAEVEICSCLGDNVKTKFEEADTNVGGPVFYQAESSSGGEWKDTLPGAWIEGQVVKLRSKCIGTGGYVKITVDGCCQ